MEKSALYTESVSAAAADGESLMEGSSSAREHLHPQPANDVRDFLIHKDGQVYAGAHLLVDFWGGSRLNDADLMAKALREAAEASDATVLHVHVHEFGGEGGVSGVAVLAESHISVHTWPELDYAAFDVFMCGQCLPEKAVAVLERYFSPSRADISEQKRGLVE
jgi:S-adenosylmethionine decarboxylase